MKSWDELPAEWDHPDCIEYRKAYGPPVYEELYFRLRGGDQARRTGKDPANVTFPEPIPRPGRDGGVIG